jgi:hypothetical protein
VRYLYRIGAYDIQEEEFVITTSRAFSLAGVSGCIDGSSSGRHRVLPDQAMALNREENQARPKMIQEGGASPEL